MGDKVIRITSQQGFADTWETNLDTPASSTKATTLNLCDFTIPSGFVIDMSSSYVAFNTQVYADDAIINAGLALTTDGANLYNVPNSALIRNCSISSSNAGQLEAVRRNDTLACGIWGLSHTAEEKKGDMNTLACYNNGAGDGIRTSFNLDRVSNNTSPDGGTTLVGLGGLPLTSAQISRDVKVPLKDMFGVGVVEDWDTSKWGETRIHLETNFDKLLPRQFGGDENTLNGFDGTNPQGSIVAPVGTIPATTGAVPNPVELTHKFGEWEYTCPFYVGQSVLVDYTLDGTPVPATTPIKIVSMRFQTDNTANPITGDSAVFIELETPYYSNATGTPTTVTLPLMRAALVNVMKITVNRAELVLYTKEQGKTSSAYEYTTYTSEEDNGNGITNFNRGYMLEPEAENFFIACCKESAILPNREITSYRYALNNDEQTGNRDIDAGGSPLQFERLTRCLDRSAQIPFRNTQLKFYNQGTTQLLAYDSPISMICETCEVLPTSKMLNINIVSAGLNQIIIYKQIPKRISV